MWFENSVKYLKPFSPQPTQFPENPAEVGGGGGNKRGQINAVSFKTYSMSGADKVVLPAGG